MFKDSTLLAAKTLNAAILLALVIVEVSCSNLDSVNSCDPFYLVGAFVQSDKFISETKKSMLQLSCLQGHLSAELKMASGLWLG